jgi:hypothetical protein
LTEPELKITAGLKVSAWILAFFAILAIVSPAEAYIGLSAESGGGYSSNLYADSFSIGDSYMFGAFTISHSSFTKTIFRVYYDLAYYQYDTRNSINQFDHLAGLTLFRKQLGERVKWSIDLAGTYRDYADANANYDNYKFYAYGNLAYYLISGTQMNFGYQLKQMKYNDFAELNHLEHRLSAFVSQTLPSRTTIKGSVDYSLRNFDIDNSNVDWLDLELRLSQSIDIRTGVAGSGMVRFAGSGTRPLSSYTVISGVTTYWDPWDGYQFNLFGKRILPWGLVSIANFNYWHREFDYTDTQTDELPWLSPSGKRIDNGQNVELELTRQLNLNSNYARALKLSLVGGYLTNDSDDPYYDYGYYYVNLSVKLEIR